MYKVISTEVIIVNGKKAMELLRFNTYEHQRSLRQWYVNELADKMLAGEYTGGRVVLTSYGSVTLLIDGQHTLSAIAQSQAPVEVVFQKVKCHFETDVALLWQQFDGGIPRGMIDYVRSESGALNTGWPARDAALITGGAVIAKYGPSGNRRVSKKQRTALIKEYLSEGDFIHKMLTEDNPTIAKFLRRQTIVAVMMLSFQKDQKDAFLFWDQVKTGELLLLTDPAYHLRNFLLSSNVRGLRLSKIVPMREFYVKAVKSWNAFRAGHKRKVLRYAVNEVIPTVI